MSKVISQIENLVEALGDLKDEILYAQEKSDQVSSEYLKRTRCGICMKLMNGTYSMIMPEHHPERPAGHTDCWDLLHAREAMIASSHVLLDAPFGCRKAARRYHQKAVDAFSKAYIKYCLTHGLQMETQWTRKADVSAIIVQLIEERMACSWKQPFPDQEKLLALHKGRLEQKEE